MRDKKIDQITRDNYDTEEHRAARRLEYRTDDPLRCFEREIGYTLLDRAYRRALDSTIEELRKEGENHGKRYYTLMPVAAELIEYWYNNAPETYMFRHPSPQELRQCFESHRPAAFWVRLLRMEHEAAKQEQPADIARRSSKTHLRIPPDFAVQPLKPGQPATTPTQCGHCGLSWDDAIATGYTPAPAARCPFEYFHVYPKEKQP